MYWRSAGLAEGAEIHVAIPQGEPHAERQEGIEGVAFGEWLNTAYLLKESFGRDAMPKVHLTYIITAHGKPRSKYGSAMTLLNG
jgi:hypothetical protein